MDYLRLVALVLPLALDTFAVAAAVGVASPALEVRDRVRLGLVFAAFEGAMPLVGLLLGAALAGPLAAIADYAAAAALVVVALHMLLGGEAREERAAAGLVAARGLALVALGLSVSMDELAMGFVLGLLRVPIVPALALVAIQAFIVSQAGLALGTRIGGRWREAAEKLAAAALLTLAVVVVGMRLAGG